MAKAAGWLAVALGCACVCCTSRPGMDFGAGLDVPYVQTPLPVVVAILQLAQVQRGETVIDLGCGDGRIVVTAATDFGARGIGYDLDPERVAESWERARRAGVADRTQFSVENVLTADISQADVVVLYLFPLLIESLHPRLLSELSAGTRVVSHTYPIRDWKAERKIQVEGRTLYLYRVPERAPLRKR